MSAAALAEELEVSVRSVYRDVQTLRAQGAGITGEAGVGYLLQPGFLLPPLMFSDEELEAIDVIVSPDGAVWFTDTSGGRVFRVASERALQANSAEIWAAGPEVGPPPGGGSGANGLDWLGDRLIVANSGQGTLVEFDPKSTEPTRGAHVIALSNAQTHDPMQLCSPDGVERVPGSQSEVVVVENGGCAAKKPRVVRITLQLD